MHPQSSCTSNWSEYKNETGVQKERSILTMRRGP